MPIGLFFLQYDFGKDSRLFINGINQTIDFFAMLGALAEGKDAGVAGAKLIVHDDGAVDHQAGRFGFIDVRTNTTADDHHVGVQRGPILEAQAGDFAVA